MTPMCSQICRGVCATARAGQGDAAHQQDHQPVAQAQEAEGLGVGHAVAGADETGAPQQHEEGVEARHGWLGAVGGRGAAGSQPGLVRWKRRRGRGAPSRAYCPALCRLRWMRVAAVTMACTSAGGSWGRFSRMSR